MKPRKQISFLINALAFVLISYGSYLLILLSLPYIHFEPYVDFLATKQLIYHIRPWRYSFYIHVFSSPLVIIAGLFQFSPWLFRKSRRFHRASGYVYVSVVLLISGPAAFIMSLYANGGYLSQISFVSLSSLWLLFTFISFWKARKLDFEAHVKWNIRSYALTLSAITLRFYSYMFDVFGFELGPRETYIMLAYLSWIPNLLFAELLIYWKYPRYLLSARD